MTIRRITKANAPKLRFEVIGYSASGKTSLYTAMKEMLDKRTPSGVFMKTVGDPSEFIRQRDLTNRRIGNATQNGMETTLGTEAQERFQFCATYRTETMFTGELCECMGQAIENPQKYQEEYASFVERIPKADVLWLVLPLSQIDDKTAFEEICRTCHSYLWHALEVRRDNGITKPPVIGIVGTKMDTLGPSTSKVSERLSCLGLSYFGEIPGTVSEFGIKESAVFPTTFFGCGKAIEVPGKADEYRLSDITERPVPENIDSLFYWSLAACLMPFRNQSSKRGSPSLADVFERLRKDLRDSEPVSLGIAGELIATDVECEL